MEFYLEPARNISVLAIAEVLVVGGGPSDIAAAMSAAREGAATILIERFGCFGGMMTTTGVESTAWWRHENTAESGELAHKIEETAESMGASSSEPQSNSQAINAERFKLVADAMPEQTGVRRVLHITAAGVIKQGDSLLDVVMENKSGRQIILANTITNCTGDADIAWFAGVPFTKREREELMCMIIISSCANINKNAFTQNVKSAEPKHGDRGTDEESKN